MAYQNLPNKVYCVQYYNQFAKHFLKLYGQIKDCLEENQILKEIKPINCEYLGRPKIALSEMGETCSKYYERAIDILLLLMLLSLKKPICSQLALIPAKLKPKNVPIQKSLIFDPLIFYCSRFT